MFCSSCGKSLWTPKGVCGNCGNPHARIDLYHSGKTHYFFKNVAGYRLGLNEAKALLGVIQTDLEQCRQRGIPFDNTKYKVQERKTIGRKLDEYIEHKELALSRKRLHPSSLLSIQSHITNYIRPYFGGLLEDELSRSLLSNFLDSLPQTLKRKTRINIYTTLKSFIKWAGYDVKFPTIDEDDDSAERVALTYEEQMEALERIPERHRDIIEFAMETGLRTGEVCVLMPIDLTPRGTIWVRRTLSGDQIIETTKAGSRIELALSDRALEIARKQTGRERSVSKISYDADTQERIEGRLDTLPMHGHCAPFLFINEMCDNQKQGERKPTTAGKWGK
jgi:integrase